MTDKDSQNDDQNPAEQPPPDVPADKVKPDGDVQTEPGEVDDGTDKHLAKRWQIEEHSLLIKIVLVVVALIGIFIILATWRLLPFSIGSETTNNAYVHGRTTVISPQVGGYVTEILVSDYDRVAAGQLLVKIDDRLYRNQVEQAEAQLEVREADLLKANQKEAQSKAQIASAEATIAAAEASYRSALADYKRTSVLVKTGSVSQRVFDMSKANKESAEASVIQARTQLSVARENLLTVEVSKVGLQAAVNAAAASVESARINLSYTEIVAPRAGSLSSIDVKLGQLASAGSPFFYLVPEDLWVIANLKEVQTRDIREGQSVSMTVDALDNAEIHGRVERISPAAGSEFSVSSPDRSAGNFVKVPQRISVRVALDPSQEILERLRPGMSVEAKFQLSGDHPPYQRQANSRARGAAPYPATTR